MSDTKAEMNSASNTFEMSEAQTCSICQWTNVGLKNYGEPGKPRWVCQTCCYQIVKQADQKPMNQPSNAEMAVMAIRTLNDLIGYIKGEEINCRNQAARQQGQADAYHDMRVKIQCERDKIERSANGQPEATP